VCEYGGDPQVACDQVFKCNGGLWNLTQVGGACVRPDGGSSSSCPSSFDQVPQGSECTAGGAECDYPQAYCTCNVRCFDLCPGPDSGAPNYWQCDVPHPANGCPIPRPPLGSACSQPGQQCDYGGCNGNITEQCSPATGIWVVTYTPCPA
jgi:hypothetical protein